MNKEHEWRPEMYALVRHLVNWCFEHTDMVKPHYYAIYVFALEHCNRLGWKDKFGLPTSMAMEATGIRNKNTYHKYLNEMFEIGFLTQVEKSKNQYSSMVVSLYPHSDFAGLKIKSAYREAVIQHTVQHGDSIRYGSDASTGDGSDASSDASTGDGSDTINKPYTINHIPINQVRLESALLKEKNGMTGSIEHQPIEPVAIASRREENLPDPVSFRDHVIFTMRPLGGSMDQLKEFAELAWDHCNANGWMIKEGVPMDNWKSWIQSKKKWYKEFLSKPNNGQTNKDRTADPTKVQSTVNTYFNN